MITRRIAPCILIAFSLEVSAEIQYPINHQRDRILPHLENIDSYIDRAKAFDVENDPDRRFEKQSKLMDDEDLRDSLRDLQNLFRIYSGKVDPDVDIEQQRRDSKYGSFLGFYESAKEFEDHISHFRDYKSFYQTAIASGNQAAIDRYKMVLDEEASSYRAFIAESDWFAGDRTDDMRDIVTEFQWPPLEEDRNDILKTLAKKMKKIHEKEYDMTEVEDGIHELRRDARRIYYLSYSVNEIVQKLSDPNDCALGQPIQDDAERKGGDSYYCEIDECLLDKVDNASGTLANLKSRGAQFEAQGIEVPQGLKDEAENLHDDLKASSVFLHLSYQLSECRTPVP